MDTKKVDRSHLTLSEVAQLDQYELSNKQLAAFEKMSTTIEGFLSKLAGKDDTKEMSALLSDMRAALGAIRDKEYPETMDYASPVVKAVGEAEKTISQAIAKIEVKPEFKPNVTVKAPEVNVPKIDLKGIETVLRKDLANSFRSAIEAIPTPELPDNSEMVDRLDAMLGLLGDIDIGVRLKPQPGSMKVTNPDGSLIGASGGGSGTAKATDAYGIQAISDDGTYKYFFFEDASANWYVMRKALATSVFNYTKGTGGYASVYVDATHGPSGSPTFAGYGVTF